MCSFLLKLTNLKYFLLECSINFTKKTKVLISCSVLISISSIRNTNLCHRHLFMYTANEYACVCPQTRDTNMITIWDVFNKFAQFEWITMTEYVCSSDRALNYLCKKIKMPKNSSWLPGERENIPLISTPQWRQSIITCLDAAVGNKIFFCVCF